MVAMHALEIPLLTDWNKLFTTKSFTQIETSPLQLRTSKTKEFEQAVHNKVLSFTQIEIYFVHSN